MGVDDAYTVASKHLEGLGFRHPSYRNLVVAAKALHRGTYVGVAGKFMILKKGSAMVNWLDAHTVLNHPMSVELTRNTERPTPSLMAAGFGLPNHTCSFPVMLRRRGPGSSD